MDKNKQKVIPIIFLTFLLMLRIVGIVSVTIPIYSTRGIEVPFETIEDDLSVTSRIVSTYMENNTLVIEFQSNSLVTVNGLSADRFDFVDNKVIISNYQENEYFQLVFGESSDISLFGDTVYLKDVDGEVDVKEGELLLERWGGESFIKINRSTLPDTALVDGITGTVKLLYGDYDVVIYELDKFELGGVEYEIELGEIPESNVFLFVLDSQLLEFYYQPPLTQEEIDAGAFRPENVIGSYAVYHSTKRDNEYKTGKAFHIYRPFAYDSKGLETWCDLLIENGLMSITVPQDFLDKAVYPVIVDPSFGYTGEGGSSGQSLGGDWAYGSLFTSPATEGMTGVSMSIYGGEGGSVYNIKMVMWKHSDLTILANAITPPVSFGGYGSPPGSEKDWATGTFGTSPDIASSTDYVLGFVDGGDGVFYSYDTGDTNQGHADATNSYTSPETFQVAWHSTEKMSIYCNYTVAEEGEDYVVDFTQSLSTTWNIILKWAARVIPTQSLSTSYAVVTKWDAEVIPTQSIGTSFNVLISQGFVVVLSQALTTTWNVILKWAAIAIPTQSLTTTWNVIVKWVAEVIPSLSLSTTYNVIIKWDAIAILTQALTTTYEVILNHGMFVDLTQALATTWDIVTKWSAISILSQSLSTTWNVLANLNMVVILTQALTTTWNIILNHAMFVELSQAISTTWNVLANLNMIVILTQALTTTWNIILNHSMFVDLSQALTTTWNVLVDLTHIGVEYIADLGLALSTTWNVIIHSDMIVIVSQALSTTWTVLIDYTHEGVAYIVDLALAIATTWSMDSGRIVLRASLLLPMVCGLFAIVIFGMYRTRRNR